MRVYLVQPSQSVDADTLCLAAMQFPAVVVEPFDTLDQVLMLRPSAAPVLICVARALLDAHSVAPLRRLRERQPQARLAVIERSGDLLSVLARLEVAPAPLLDAAPDDLAAPRLSAREMEVLLLLREGLQNKLIARRLDLSVSTVKTHIANLFRKLGARNRLEAICRYGAMAQSAGPVTVWPLPWAAPAGLGAMAGLRHQAGRATLTA